MRDAKDTPSSGTPSKASNALKAVIFDLDGTLLDTLAAIADAGNHAMQSVGRPEHPVEAYNTFAGQGLPNMIKDALGPDHQDLFDDAIAAHKQRYGTNAHSLTTPFTGIDAMLGKLAAAGLDLCVLSNKLHDATRADIDTFLSHHPWHTVVGLRDGYEPKPDTRTAQELAQGLGLADDTSQIAYVGDTAADMLTGSGCGFFTVGVLWGFRDEAELRANGADAVVRNAEELQRVLLGH